MLNKDDIFNILNKYSKLDKNEYIVISGAAMVIHDIKENAKDIDIAVTKNLYDKLIQNYDCKFERFDDKSNINIYYIDDVINFSTNYIDSEYETINGIKVQTPKDIINLKKKLNRKKDKIDILKIKEYLNDKDR